MGAVVFRVSHPLIEGCKFFLYICIVCFVLFNIVACNPCKEDRLGNEDLLLFLMLDKTTHQNLLDYAAGSWTDTVRVWDLQDKKIVGQKPGADGSMSFAFFNEKTDSDALSTIKNKKYSINLKYTKDTFDISFKMKENQCGDSRVETMRIKYKDSTYYYSTDITTFVFVKP